MCFVIGLELDLPFKLQSSWLEVHVSSWLEVHVGLKYICKGEGVSILYIYRIDFGRDSTRE